MRASNGVSLPRQASTRQRAGDERRGHRALGGEQPGERERRRHLRAVEQREAFLRRRARPARARARASASRAGMTRPSTRASPSPISTADKMRERREIAGRADRALRRECTARCRRWPARRSASITLQRTPEWPRASDAALSAMTRRTTASSSSGPVPARMRQHERALQLGEPRVVDARAREEPEAGVDAVDGLARRDDRARPSPPPHRRRASPRGRWPREGAAHSRRRSASASAPGRSVRVGHDRTRPTNERALCRRSRRAPPSSAAPRRSARPYICLNAVAEAAAHLELLVAAPQRARPGCRRKLRLTLRHRIARGRPSRDGSARTPSGRARRSVP